VGGLIGLATALAIIPFCSVMNRLMDLPMRPYSGEEALEPLEDDQLPPLWLSLAPIVLPVLMISTDTITQTLATRLPANTALRQAEEITALVGNANLALLVSAAIAMLVLVVYRKLSFAELAGKTETALMSGGVIILITAGGGAFGAMLRQAGVKDSILDIFGSEPENFGLLMLALGFSVAAVMKIAQGSSTVAMIVTSAMLASMAGTGNVFQPLEEMLGCHPVYLCTAIGGGSLVGSWMNDSGFWIFARMSGLTEVETLKAWSVLLVIIGLLCFGFTLLFAWALPLV